MIRTKKSSPSYSYLAMTFLLSLTIGLAPFAPEPHIVGKIKWVLGGAENMKMIDFLDLGFHGFPWVLLISALVLKLVALVKSKE